MRILAPLLAAAFLLGGTGDKTYKLADLLPKPKKGQEEKIELEVAIGYPKGDEFFKKTVTTTLTRKIKSLDDDGRPAREELSVDGGKSEEEQKGENGGWSSSSGVGAWHETVRREGKARKAGVAGLPTGVDEDLAFALKDDPDGLVRAILPEGEVSKGEEWDVEPAKLLALLVPGKTKPSEKCKATATLDGVKKGVAHVSLEATLRYTTADEPDDEKKLTVTFTFHAKLDASAPPSDQKLVIVKKHKDPDSQKDVKATVSLVMTRKWSDADDESDDKKKDEDEEK